MDEAWSMLKDGMGDFVEYMFRTLRKNKGQMGIITQGITEIVNSKVGKALINNSETKIILRHTNVNELANLQAHLGFTDSELGKLANLQFTKGARQFFVKQGENSDVYTLEVPLEEMAVLTSQPDERNHLIKLKDKYLGKINNAIQQWVEDFSNNNIKKS
jgi:conjugal transfer ATP-binding protein TraC